MVGRTYSCRYCGAEFVPQAGKPGYIDECPDCLHEKTRPAPPPDVQARFLARYPDRRRALKDLRKNLLGLGLDESVVEGAIADWLTRAV